MKGHTVWFLLGCWTVILIVWAIALVAWVTTARAQPAVLCGKCATPTQGDNVPLDIKPSYRLDSTGPGEMNRTYGGRITIGGEPSSSATINPMTYKSIIIQRPKECTLVVLSNNLEQLEIACRREIKPWP